MKLVLSLNVNVNAKTKLKIPLVSRFRELQSLNRNDTVPYRQNNNWTRTEVILSKNNMPLSHILINVKDNVIRRNKRPLIKTENDNDMDNDTETKPKTRDSTSATESGEVHEPRENATELRETSRFTTRSGK